MMYTSLPKSGMPSYRTQLKFQYLEGPQHHVSWCYLGLTPSAVCCLWDTVSASPLQDSVLSPSRTSPAVFHTVALTTYQLCLRVFCPAFCSCVSAVWLFTQNTAIVRCMSVVQMQSVNCIQTWRFWRIRLLPAIVQMQLYIQGMYLDRQSSVGGPLPPLT